MFNRAKSVAKTVLELRQVFAHSDGFCEIERLFQMLLERRQTELHAGLAMEARGLAVVGASGSGKTTALARLFSHTKGLVIDDSRTARTDVVSFQVPSPATLKFVGQTALVALGYPLQRDKTEMVIWQMVKEHLRRRSTLFLHLDESQDLLRHQTPRTLQAVVRTLKSLMQNSDWPVSIILSGTHEVKELLNHDVQLARRFYPIELPRLHAGANGTSERVLDLVCAYACRASVSTNISAPNEFVARLVHAADGEFGLVVELIIGAIEQALLIDAPDLKIEHFAACFRQRAACSDGLNPFLADDFDRIRSRVLLQDGQIS